MKELICIVCPRGCKLQVDDDFNVKGNLCPRGIPYAKSELTNPTRVLTSTIAINSAITKRLPVMSMINVPKDRVLDAIKVLDKVLLNPPIRCGEVVYKNILNLGVDIIATRSIEK